jgi:hypothetical protein
MIDLNNLGSGAKLIKLILSQNKASKKMIKNQPVKLRKLDKPKQK